MEQISFAIDGHVQGLAAAFGGRFWDPWQLWVCNCFNMLKLPSGYVKIAIENGH